jgi:ParB-like chromosome segregation protein Spo0J
VETKLIDIREDAIRTVDPESDHTKNLCFSVGEFGVIESISIYPNPDIPGRYVCQNGGHRLFAAKFNKHDMIPVRIVDIEADEANFGQIMLNCQAKSDSPMVIARTIKRLLANPKFASLTSEEFKAKLGFPNKSLSWFDNQLALGKLIPEAQELVEKGVIKISAAYSLATLPVDQQIEFIEAAQTEKIDDFNLKVAAQKTENKAKKEGKDPAQIDPLKRAKIRKLTELKLRVVELEDILIGLPDTTKLNEAEQVIFQAGLASGQYAELMRVLRLDPETEDARKAEQKAKDATKTAFVDRRKKLMDDAKQVRDAQLAQEFPERVTS